MIYITGGNGSIGRYMTGVKRLNMRLESSAQVMMSGLKEEKPQTIIHLAANTNVSEIEQDKDYYRDVNVNGSEKLFSAFVKNGGKRFIYVSTGHVYGHGHKSPVSEKSETNPISEYAQIKLQTEAKLSELASKYSVELLSARVFSVFGRGMAIHYLASKVERCCEKNEDFAEIPNSLDVRDFLTPEQVSQYLLELAQSPNWTGIEVVNVCSARPTSIAEKVLEFCPTYPPENLIAENSQMPYLVGENKVLESMLAK